MRSYLQHDSETGRLLLVIVDYWKGQHERTEFHVVGESGRPVRGQAHLDGLPAYHDAAGTWWVRMGGGRPPVPFAVKAGERSETERTPCPRAENKRRKCTLCATV